MGKNIKQEEKNQQDKKNTKKEMVSTKTGTRLRFYGSVLIAVVRKK